MYSCCPRGWTAHSLRDSCRGPCHEQAPFPFELDRERLWLDLNHAVTPANLERHWDVHLIQLCYSLQYEDYCNYY
jgi:hypothetical protein